VLLLFEQKKNYQSPNASCFQKAWREKPKSRELKLEDKIWKYKWPGVYNGVISSYRKECGHSLCTEIGRTVLLMWTGWEQVAITIFVSHCK
jgi:hypothetical protein